MNRLFTFMILFFLDAFIPYYSLAQPWEFIKEKNGIKLYTRMEAENSIKAFKGVADISAPAEKIFDVIRDISNTDWWDKNINLTRVLYYEKNIGSQYYLVIDLPWPVPDRDLCVDVSVTSDQASGERRISAVSTDGIIPERNGMVRIKDYRQTWMIRPESEKLTHVEIEGLFDPGGNIPDWVINILIMESPFKSISGLRNRMRQLD